MAEAAMDRRKAQSLTSIKSLAPLFSLGWVRETAKRKGCLAAWGLKYVTSMILTFSVTLSIFHIYIYLQNILTSSAPEKCQQLECTCLNGAGGDVERNRCLFKGAKFYWSLRVHWH